ncbi:Response regulator GacA [Anaerolineae bacterium]|nr:Response regulator GacA [Anaerolineae bacterium]
MMQTDVIKHNSLDPIRVQLASNFILLRAGLRSILEDRDNISIVGESAVGAETVAQACELHPDVLILDVCANDHNTLAVIEPVQRELGATKIIALSDTENSDFALRLLRAGVKGYLTHLDAVGELVSAVQTVAHDQVFLCPTASSALVTK